ncbi:MAG: hypothetical protein WBN09_12060 [Woeseiaceae bacterium]
MHIKWVQENLPALSLRGEEEIRKVVREAEKAVRPWPTLLSICGAVAGAAIGYIVSDLAKAEGMGRWESLVYVLAGTAVVTFLANLLGNAIVHREIEAIDRGKLLG